MNNSTEQPLISRQEVQRGRKGISVALKSGEVYPVIVTAPAWPAVAELHFQHGMDEAAVESALLKLCLPETIFEPDPLSDVVPDPEPRPGHEWIEWLDLDSRNFVTRVVREFTYGYLPEKKRREAARQIGTLLLKAGKPTPSNAPGSGSATPSSGASPSSSPAPSASGASKPTTA